jgi:hypothetical protein
MPTITVFKTNQEINKDIVMEKLKEKNIMSKISMYNNKEIHIIYPYKIDIEKVFNDLDYVNAENVISILKQNGIEKITKKIYIFLNYETKTLEIYNGKKGIIEEILKVFNDIGLNFYPIEFERKTFKPNINFINSNSRYKITVFGNKIKYNNRKPFKFLPRFEIRQIVNQLLQNGG